MSKVSLRENSSDRQRADGNRTIMSYRITRGGSKGGGGGQVPLFKFCEL